MLKYKDKNKKGLAGLIRAVNARGADDGRRFTDDRRRKAVMKLAGKSKSFKLLLDDGFSLVYGAPVQPDRPVVLLSCHIDHPFKQEELFINEDAGGVIGTLDNAACAGLVLDLMRGEMLPDNVLAAFTANEERGMRGARALVKHLSAGKLKAYAARLAAVITLDVTPDNAGKPVSLENVAPNKVLRKKTGFGTPGSVVAWMGARLGVAGVPYGSVLKALPDESRVYSAAGLSAMSFCLPVKASVNGNKADVHDPKGVRCAFSTMRLWQKGLCVVVSSITN